ncbi:MAG: hypothetical protein J6C87_00630 [Bacteroides sp.]|nr:hypothetical protein [Bacteroides sp.]
MKKCFYSVFAAATLLLAASCSQDEDFVQPSGEMTTFSVSLENAATTRAAGDGQTVDKLYYEVYQGENKVLDSNATITGRLATVEMPLLKGEKYDIIFWAQSSKSTIYDASNLKEIEVKYENITANDEANDAFFNALVDFKAGGNVTTVELRRPFAQLNIGTTTDDWAKAQKMVEGDTAPVTQSKVTVNGLANVFNALTGEATGDEDVTFKAADLIGETFTTNEKVYQSLSMNYLLVPGEKAPQGLGSHEAATGNNVKITTDITATFWRSTTELFTLEVPNVPVQRNYRTNIIGDLLAGNKTFEIVVKEGFDNDHNIEKAYVATTAEFKEIIDALNAEGYNGPKNVVITLDGDIEWTTGAGHGTTPFLTENSIVETLTIMGQNNTITAIGQGIGAIRAANGGKLIFNDVVVADESESYTEGSWEMGYLEFAGKLEFNNSTFVNAIMVCGATANNSTGGDATFTNCTFNSNKESEYDVWVSGNNATFTECTFQGYRGLKMHEAYGSEITSVTVDACTFDNLSKKPGVAIGTVNAETAVTIKNSLFHNCQAGDQGLYIYESDTDVTTFNFSVDENNTVINDGEASDLTITNVATFKAFAAAVNNGTSYAGKTVTLAADLDLNNEPWTPIGYGFGGTGSKQFSGTFDGNGKTISNLNITEAVSATAGLFGWANGTIKDLTIDGANINVSNPGEGGVGVVVGVYAESGSLTVENVTVKNAKVSGTRRIGAIVGYNNGTITNCTVENVELKAIPNLSQGVYDNGDKVGGIAGYNNADNNVVLSNNIVSELTIVGYRDLGGILGAGYGTTEENSVTNATIVLQKVAGAYDGNKASKNAGEIIGSVLSTEGAGNVSSNVTIVRGAINSGRIEYIESSNRYQIAADFAAAGVKSLAVKVLDQNANLITTITPEGYNIPTDGKIGTIDDNSQSSWTTICAAVTGNSSSWQNTAFVPSASVLPTTMVLVVNDYVVAQCGVTQQYTTWNDVLTGIVSEVTDASGLATALSSAPAGQTIKLASDVNLGTTQLVVDKAVTIDLNGKELTTAFSYGGVSLKSGASIKNGTIKHTSTVAAVKVLGNIGSIEDVTITCQTIENKTITGIQIVNGGKSVESLKNVTITGATQGIEVKDCTPNNATTPTIGVMENVKVDATNVGMIVNGWIGKATNCEFKGTNYGIDMLLKGEYKVSLELDNCTLTGGTTGLWAHDEKGIPNTNNCSFSLTYDAETTIEKALIWDFEEECQSVLTLNAPNN